MNLTILKIKIKIKNLLYKNYIKYLRLSSKPFISGDTFRNISDHVFDENSNLKINKINSHDIVFVKTDYLNLFINKYINLLPNNIILITHNSDINIEREYKDIFRKKQIFWFAQNLNFKVSIKDNILPLPIGFENRNWFKNGKLSNLKKYQPSKVKNDKILCSFNPQTNPERIEILNYIQNSEVITFSRRSNHFNFMNSLSQCKFSICPPGNGLDTHRIWESLMVETIPIMEKSEFSSNLKFLKIPIYELEEWSEISNLNKEKVRIIYSHYSELLKDKSFLYIDYWKNVIYEKNK